MSLQGGRGSAAWLGAMRLGGRECAAAWQPRGVRTSYELVASAVQGFAVGHVSAAWHDEQRHPLLPVALQHLPGVDGADLRWPRRGLRIALHARTPTRDPCWPAGACTNQHAVACPARACQQAFPANAAVSHLVGGRQQARQAVHGAAHRPLTGAVAAVDCHLPLCGQRPQAGQQGRGHGYGGAVNVQQHRGAGCSIFGGRCSRSQRGRRQLRNNT